MFNVLRVFLPCRTRLDTLLITQKHIYNIIEHLIHLLILGYSQTDFKLYYLLFRVFFFTSVYVCFITLVVFFILYTVMLEVIFIICCKFFWQIVSPANFQVILSCCCFY